MTDPVDQDPSYEDDHNDDDDDDDYGCDLAPSPEDIEHARHGPPVKRRGAGSAALGAAMLGLGKVLEPEKHERTQIEAEAPDDDAGDDDLLKRISFGTKDPLW